MVTMTDTRKVALGCPMGHPACVEGASVQVGDVLTGFGTFGGARVLSLRDHETPAVPGYRWIMATVAGGPPWGEVLIDPNNCTEIAD